MMVDSEDVVFNVLDYTTQPVNLSVLGVTSILLNESILSLDVVVNKGFVDTIPVR
jgi:hypothetical protein